MPVLVSVQVRLYEPAGRLISRTDDLLTVSFAER